jgi:hypothetical protein
VELYDVLLTCKYSYTHIRYIKAPKQEVETEAERERREMDKKQQAEKDAFGTYASKGGQQLVYRVKKQGAFGGYKIVTEV